MPHLPSQHWAFKALPQGVTGTEAEAGRWSPSSQGVWGEAVLPHVHTHLSVPGGEFVPVCLHLCVHLQKHT